VGSGYNKNTFKNWAIVRINFKFSYIVKLNVILNFQENFFKFSFFVKQPTIYLTLQDTTCLKVINTSVFCWFKKLKYKLRNSKVKFFFGSGGFFHRLSEKFWKAVDKIWEIIKIIAKYVWYTAVYTAVVTAAVVVIVIKIRYDNRVIDNSFLELFWEEIKFENFKELTPNPETPNPETPDSETLNPETPDSETLNPETPDSETLNPETPDSETPYVKLPVSNDPRLFPRYRWPYKRRGEIMAEVMLRRPPYNIQNPVIPYKILKKYADQYVDPWGNVSGEG
jgi:hypothetical protein